MINLGDAAQSLLPLLREDDLHFVKTEGGKDKIVRGSREFLKNVLPLRNNELVFLDELLERGKIVPSLLTDDSELMDRISNPPKVRGLDPVERAFLLFLPLVRPLET